MYIKTDAANAPVAAVQPEGHVDGLAAAGKMMRICIKIDENLH